MSPEQKALLRTRILRILAEIAPRGLALQSIHTGCTLEGFNVKPNELDAEVDYLLSKGFVDRREHPVSAGMKLYHLTAAGREHLEREGLA